MNIFYLEVDSFKFGLFIVGDRCDEVFDIGNEDLVVGSDKFGYYI